MDWDDLNQTTAADDDEESGGDWIVTFSDLMSLLLCFFILLFSFSTVEQMKFKQLIASLQDAFGVQEVPKAGTREGLEMPDIEHQLEPDAVDELGGMVMKEMESIKAEVEEFILKNNLQGKVEVQTNIRGTVVTISDVVLFPVGEADFNPQAYPILQKITEMLEQFPYHVKVEGHTDNQPIHTALFPSNWELSACRASRLVRFFVDHGIDPSRLSAEGYAEYHPVADNSTPEGRAKNRRVEIVYTRDSIIEKMKEKIGEKAQASDTNG